MDLGFEGPKFTWNNRQGCDTNVKCRLDRAIANGDFSRMFENCVVENLITTSSDHYAILIILSGNSSVAMQPPVQQGFRFEAMWTEGSARPRSLQSTWANLGRVATSLKDWSRATFGSVRKQIRRLEGKLRDLCECMLTDDLVLEEKKIEGELCELFEREEIMARQRSCVDWLREGDRNTSFFHARATTRRKTNRIDVLRHPDGLKCKVQSGIKGMVQQFYENLFFL
jgi:hypothetical protein